MTNTQLILKGVSSKIKKYPHLLTLVFLIPTILFLHYQNSLSFSFTDAYQSFVRAYFMMQGRTLYAEIFSHHNFLMVYLSYIIQYITRPDSLLQLVVYHRMAVGLASAIFATYLIVRHKWTGVAFVIAFETSKYYLFGNLFLAEALVAYLLVILLGIAWEKAKKKSITRRDILISIVAAWAVVFLREPLIPPAFLLFAFIIWGKEHVRLKIASVTALVVSTIAIIFATLDLYEYYFHMIPLNFSGYIQSELAQNSGQIPAILSSFIYPILILVSGENTEFRIILIIVNLLFLLGIISLLQQRKFTLAISLIALLGLANIRVRTPGGQFYDAFHMLPYYALLLFSGILLTLKSGRKIFKFISIIAAIAVATVSLLPSYSPLIEDQPREMQFIINYSRFVENGEVIRLLADKDDTLFVDEWDTLIYWQSGLDSSYEYAMYFPVMRNFSKFSESRKEMLENNPPDFYYRHCNKNEEETILKPEVIKNYALLFRNNMPTCIYIHNEKLTEISQEQWRQVGQKGYNIPQNLLRE